MRINFNRPTPIQKPKNSKLEKPVLKKAIKKERTPVTESDIRAKIAKHKAKLENPAVKKVATSTGDLQQILKRSNFGFSEKERKVFAKILSKEN